MFGIPNKYPMIDNMKVRDNKSRIKYDVVGKRGFMFFLIYSFIVVLSIYSRYGNNNFEEYSIVVLFSSAASFIVYFILINLYDL